MVTGENDDRVIPSNMLKYIASLYYFFNNNNNSIIQRNPVIAKIIKNFGHNKPKLKMLVRFFIKKII